MKGYRRFEKQKARLAAPGKIRDMETFCRTVKKALEEHFGDGYEIRIQNIMKDNRVPATVASIHCMGCGLWPSVCIDSMYKKYLMGELADIHAVCGTIITAFEEIKKNTGLDTSVVEDFSKAQERVCLRLVNAEWNRKMLECVPSTPFQDLAAVYYILAADSREGTGHIAVDRGMLDMWHIDTETLHAAALANTQRLYQPRLLPMDGMLPGMFMATNHVFRNGASVILYEGFLSGFASRECCSFYIMPAFIHGTVLVPEHYVQDAGCLRDVLADISTKKRWKKEERLSGNIYRYDRESGRLEIA